MRIEESNRKAKRFVAIFDDGQRVHFGSKGSSTFIDHGDKQKREAYIARHRHPKLNEDWNDLRSPGALSRWLLWGDSIDLEENIEEYIRRLN